MLPVWKADGRSKWMDAVGDHVDGFEEGRRRRLGVERRQSGVGGAATAERRDTVDVRPTALCRCAVTHGR